MNKRICAAATLLAFVTVFTLTFFPVDSADASHCAQKQRDVNKAIIKATKAGAKATTAYWAMLKKFGRPGYVTAAIKYAKAAWKFKKANDALKAAQKARDDCLKQHNSGSGSDPG